MKRLFFSLLAAFSFAFASAQPATDASVIISRLQLDNVILMIPPADFVQAHFHDALDYLNPYGQVLEDIYGNSSTPFLVFSNRNFNVAIRSATPTFAYMGTGTGNNVMPCSVLEYNLSSNGTGGTNATPSLWNDLSTTSAPVITGGTFGAARPFALKLRAKPGWNYTGGAYTLGVIVTATQL
ncbi:MAG: hypothetical protein EBR19_03260 [Chitinophagaceae bacterium]|jgi:hypothetical protein|nr:hypothetical protein [Chitinophagaceae bacterium]